MKTILLGGLACLCLLFNQVWAQSSNIPNQTIRGQVIDQDTQAPLIGATISILSVNPVTGTTSDLDGTFLLKHIPVGRHQLSISYIGYEPLVLSGIILNAGKELVLDLGLTESPVSLEEIVVTANTEKSKALNEFAAVSARSFSVEETSRYAGSFYDPARMAQNFAGVSTGSGDDLFNEIVVRGNSPRGLLWRLEGIEIPNPNHFGAAGSTGGGISMLSSTTLSNSDFYTGAFPAEFGNALSGVFDLNLRNGNNQKNEYAIMVGLLGLEFGAEGPFSKNSKASYLINYRYSTLAALEGIGLSPVEDALPKYQDLSFKINLPTAKAGTFALFGLGGNNSSVFEPDPNPENWESSSDKWGFDDGQTTGVLGLSHQILTSDRSYLRSVVSASINEVTGRYFYRDELQDYAIHEDSQDATRDESFRLSTTYNHKFNAQNSLRIGAIASALSFRFRYDEAPEAGQLERLFDNQGSTQFLQGFVQWKHRWNEQWTGFAGLHYSHIMLNGKKALEPRAALEYKMNDKSSFSAALGLHSKLEHLAIYLFDGTLLNGERRRPAKNLGMTKAMHAVIGYDQSLGRNLRLKAEAYYQHLYDVPVEGDPTSTASLINASDIWDVIGTQDAISNGLGRNMGIDLTIEKFFDQSYYFLITGSLYESKFQNQDGQWYNTKFNGNHQLSILGGKEFPLKKNKVLTLNAKYIWSGGNRHTPLNAAASIEKDEAVYFENQPYAVRPGDYSRLDMGLSYRVQRKALTHTLSLDVQNVFNHLNIYGDYYNSDSNQVEAYYQTGFFPVLNYRIEF